MKILMATMGLDIEGAETHTVELSKQLKSLGHDIVIVSNGGVYLEEIEQVGIRHYSAPLHRQGVRDLLQARSVLRKVIEEEKPDVVHAHACIPAFLCGNLHKSMGFPFVTTAHGMFNTKGALRHLTNWGQRTIAVSDDIKSYLMKEYGLSEAHISVTINGIDTDKFSPEISCDSFLREFELDTAKPIVSHVSRLDEDCALVARQLIEIAPRLDQAVPGVQLVISGSGTAFDELKAESEHVNKKLGRRCIVMTGPCTDISQPLAAGDVFVGVSRTALEAMAIAKPVIVAGHEGYLGLFTSEKLDQARSDNFCCRGMSVSDPERLLGDLTEVLKLSKEEKKNLGDYSRQVIFDHYSVRKMAQDSLNVYEQVRKRKYNVLLSGYYGFDNAGDEAILESISQSLRGAGDEVELTVLTNDTEKTERDHGVKVVGRTKALSVLRAIKDCDALLFGGGSLLQDRTSTRSILYYLSIIRCAKLMGKPVMMYANGIGPVEKCSNRRRVRRAVEKADVVTLRDHGSAEELAAMGVKHEKIHITADPVFQMEPVSQARSIRLLEAAGIKAGTEFVAVSVREWKNTEAFSVELAAVCDHLRRTYNMEILFLLMQPRKDREATQRVRTAMREPSYILDESCSPKELMGVLGEAKLCLAMRLHTLIFAARMAVPTLGLVYDPKVESYLKELDLESAGDVSAFDRAAAIAKADKVMTHYDAYLSRMQIKAEGLSAAAEENERLLLKILEEHA